MHSKANSSGWGPSVFFLYKMSAFYPIDLKTPKYGMWSRVGATSGTSETPTWMSFGGGSTGGGDDYDGGSPSHPFPGECCHEATSVRARRGGDFIGRGGGEGGGG